MFNLGLSEIIVIAIVLIIVVGPQRLPEVMKKVGGALRTVRQASREIQTTVGLDELWREDVMAPPRPRVPPNATVSRQAELGPSAAAAASAAETAPAPSTTPAAPPEANTNAAPAPAAASDTSSAPAPAAAAGPVAAAAPVQAVAPAASTTSTSTSGGEIKGES